MAISNKDKNLIRKAIITNTPLIFFYWSYKSEKKKGPETPTHQRIVQPVVLGKKILKTGETKMYFRGYLLGMYSYSRDIFFTSEAETNRNKDNEFWRIYDTSKMSQVKLDKKFSLKKRFQPSDHPEYNPDDKFFNSYIYQMRKDVETKQSVWQNIGNKIKNVWDGIVKNREEENPIEDAIKSLDDLRTSQKTPEERNPIDDAVESLEDLRRKINQKPEEKRTLLQKAGDVLKKAFGLFSNKSEMLKWEDKEIIREILELKGIPEISFDVYRTSQNEVIGEIINDRLYINGVWVEQVEDLEELEKGIVKILKEYV